MKTKRINPATTLALGAAALSGFATGAQQPAEQSSSSVRTAQARQDRAALPMQQTARAAYGVSMMGGGYDPGMFRVASGGPWFAPRYNQRKARRDARRVNRAVKR